MRKVTVMSCAYSDLASCMTAQNPIWGGVAQGSGEVPRKREIFVDRIATTIST
jgi:hypothetical protein